MMLTDQGKGSGLTTRETHIAQQSAGDEQASFISSHELRKVVQCFWLSRVDFSWRDTRDERAGRQDLPSSCWSLSPQL